MSVNALTAPAHIFPTRPTLGALGLPPDAAPSLAFLGSGGLLDHRLPFNQINSSTLGSLIGFFADGPYTVVNQVPSALATNNIAAAQATVAATPMTLVSTSGAGITVLAATTYFLPSLTALATGLVIDSTPTPVVFGRHQFTAMYDRTEMISRNIRITGNAGSSAMNFVVAGYDVYGYAMSETIAHAGGATTASGLKAFKVVSSVTPSVTDAGHTFAVGTGDVFGFPIRCPLFSDCMIFWNSALITATTGFVVPDATDPATATTGDVRGTYGVQSASDGTKRLVMRVFASLGLTNTNPTTGLFGVSQFAG